MNTLSLFNDHNWLPKKNGNPAYMEHVNELIKVINQIITDDTNDNASLSGDNTFAGDNVFEGNTSFEELIQMLAGSGAVTAHAGGGQVGATALTGFYNNVSVCATSGDSTKLPVGLEGMFMIVGMDETCADAMQIYPATGEQIDSGGANTPITVWPGTTVLLSCTVDGTWVSKSIYDINHIYNLLTPLNIAVNSITNQARLFYNPAESILNSVDFTDNTVIECIVNFSPVLSELLVSGCTALRQLYLNKMDGLVGDTLDISASADSLVDIKLSTSSTDKALTVTGLELLTALKYFNSANVTLPNVNLTLATELSTFYFETISNYSVTSIILPLTANDLTDFSVNRVSTPTITGLGAGSSHTSLTNIRISHNDTLATLDVSGVSGMDDSSSFIELLDNKLLTTVTLGTGTIVTCTNFTLTGNALSTACVNDILAKLNAAGQSDGTLDMSGGTSSAPTGGGANADLLALGVKGWTVTVNP